MSVLGKLELIAPEFVDDANILDYIDIASAQVSPDMINRDLAIAYLTAHIIELRNRRGSGGVISSESEGSLSQSFHIAHDTSRLSVTAYGMEFLRVCQNSGKGLFVMRTMQA